MDSYLVQLCRNMPDINNLFKYLCQDVHTLSFILRLEKIIVEFNKIQICMSRHTLEQIIQFLIG